MMRIKIASTPAAGAVSVPVSTTRGARIAFLEGARALYDAAEAILAEAEKLNTSDPSGDACQVDVDAVALRFVAEKVGAIAEAAASAHAVLHDRNRSVDPPLIKELAVRLLAAARRNGWELSANEAVRAVLLVMNEREESRRVARIRAGETPGEQGEHRLLPFALAPAAVAVLVRAVEASIHADRTPRRRTKGDRLVRRKRGGVSVPDRLVHHAATMLDPTTPENPATYHARVRRVRAVK